MCWTISSYPLFVDTDVGIHTHTQHCNTQVLLKAMLDIATLSEDKCPYLQKQAVSDEFTPYSNIDLKS